MTQLTHPLNTIPSDKRARVFVPLLIATLVITFLFRFIGPAQPTIVDFELAGSVPKAQAIIAVQIAKSQNLLFGGTENFLVTREFSRIASRDQKLALLDCLFAVAAAEDQISAKEDNEIRQISDELRLDHPDFITIRTKHRDQLAFLNKPSA